MPNINIVDSVDSGSRSSLSATPGPANPITLARVQKLCVDQGFYRTPVHNEKLYLHHKGFDQIADLEEYSECRVLWLEGNCIQKIEGLDSMKDSLRSLYLHENMLPDVDGLNHMTVLDGLNLSDNCIESLAAFDGASDEGPSIKTSLSTLQIKNNKIRTAADLEVLRKFTKLSVLDISGNGIQDGEGEALLDILAAMPSLKSLRMNGNPFVRKMTNYRKTVLARLPALMHLDDRPVFEDERRTANAWGEGGAEAEKAMRETLKREEKENVEKRLQDFRDMVAAAKAERGDAPSESDTDSEPSEDDEPAASSAPAAAVNQNKTEEGPKPTETVPITVGPLKSGSSKQKTKIEEIDEEEEEGEAAWVPSSSAAAGVE